MHYCSTGFPMGCYVDKEGHPKDACVISHEYSQADTYYIFNHVDITIRLVIFLGFSKILTSQKKWKNNILLGGRKCNNNIFCNNSERKSEKITYY